MTKAKARPKAMPRNSGVGSNERGAPAKESRGRREARWKSTSKKEHPHFAGFTGRRHHMDQSQGGQETCTAPNGPGEDQFSLLVYLQSGSARRQRTDLCGLQVNLPPVITSLTCQRSRSSR